MTTQQKQTLNAWFRSWLTDLLKPQTLILVGALLYQGARFSYNKTNEAVALVRELHTATKADSMLQYRIDTLAWSVKVNGQLRDNKIEKLRSKCGIDWTESEPPVSDHCSIYRDAMVFDDPEKPMSLN